MISTQLSVYKGLYSCAVRIEVLREKLIQRIRPFVEAKNPGDINDSETKAFEARMRTEAEDLKLESFGIEVGAISLSVLIFSYYILSRVFTSLKPETLSKARSSWVAAFSVD